MIKHLALIDLDIEEIERRLELAPVGAGATQWGCVIDCTDCNTDCRTLYVDNAPSGGA